MASEGPTTRTRRPDAPKLALAILVVLSFAAGPATAQMQQNSAAQCTNQTFWNPVRQATPTACYNYCAANNAAACEWTSNGDCYVEFGINCHLQSGVSGWWAAVIAQPLSPMQPSSAVRGCTNWTWWSPVYKANSKLCYDYCVQNNANACEWTLLPAGECYVEFGSGCHVQSGFPGWMAAVLNAGPPANPIDVNLPVTLRPQQTNSWCWAASGQMVMEFLGSNVAQCDQANYRFGRSDCCTIPLCPDPITNHPCVQGGWPDFAHFGFACSTRNGALTFAELHAQMDAGKPVFFSWGWTGGGGHAMVARGVRELSDGTQWVMVNDPWYPCIGADNVLMTYANYVSGSDHTHWTDYYNCSR